MEPLRRESRLPWKARPWLAALCVLACSSPETQESEADQQALPQTISALVPVTNLDMERTVTFTDYPPEPLKRRCDQSFHYDNDARVLDLPLEGSVCDAGYEIDRPYVSATFHENVYGAQHSLQFTLPPRLGRDGTGMPCTGGTGCTEPTAPAPDRAELAVHAAGNERDYGIGFNYDNPKYFGFAVYIYESAGRLPLKSTVHFMQAWQYVAGAGPCGVPLHATLDNVPDTDPPQHPPQLMFHVSAHANDGGHTVVENVPIVTNTWHTFVFFLHPNSNEEAGRGVVTIWLDGSQIVDWHNDWGCNLEQTAEYTYTDNWHLRVGMYRTDPGIINQRMDMFFDNVRVASSKLQADPTLIY